MSLVILSNTQDEYIRRDSNNFVIASGNGISSPSSFVNHFRSPLVIEPDSEVAVESVKIRKGPTFDIDENNLFYIYHGRELIGVNACESTKEPVPVRIKKGTYTVDSLAERIENALNRAFVGPAIWGNFKVTVNLDTNNNFKNFKINQVALNTKPASITWAGTNDEIVPGNPITKRSYIGWNASGEFTYTNASAQFVNDGVVMLPKYPLSNCSGVFEVNFEAVAGPWTIGLSRATNPTYNNGYPPNYVVRDARNVDNEPPFYDYMIEYTGPGGVIRVQQAVTSKNNLDIVVEQLDYWQNTGVDPKFLLPIDDDKIDELNLDSVRFTLYGNALQLEIGQSGANKWFPIISPINASLNNTDRRYNFKPTNNATESLYPKLQLYDSTDELDVTTYNGLNISGWKAVTFDENNLSKDAVPGTDWYSNQIYDNPRRIRFLDARDSVKKYNASLTDYTYNMLNASSAPDYNFVIIAGPERSLTTPTQTNVAFTETYLIGFGDGRVPNMNSVLGFGKLSVLEQSTFGNGSGRASVIITPPSNSLFMSHEGFVRINNLTGVSYNGVKGSISKILYQIPRFDNSGNIEGNLYFSPGEKTYIELGNTERMILNQVDVDIVDRSERIVSDLVGSTVVVLYIRKVKR